MAEIHYYNQAGLEKKAKLPGKCENKSYRWTLDQDYYGDGVKIIFEDYFTGKKIGTKVLKNSRYGIYIY